MILSPKIGQTKYLVAVWLLLLALVTSNLKLIPSVSGAQVSVGIEHDFSKPTFGLQGPTSSQLTYDDKDGLNLKGTINHILGPPIKIANGFSNVVSGGNMASMGMGLKTGGAVLGFDSKLLETAGLGHLLKGDLLMGGAVTKTAKATAVGGLPGKKISSIIEVPVKVVAMKDIAVGKGLHGLGTMKAVEAMVAKQRGETMIRDGEALKAKGMNQVMQGANEGMANFNNMVQQTAGNAATAFKLLPIILDMPQQQKQQEQQPIEQQQQIEQKPQQQQQTLESAQQAQHQAPPEQHSGGLIGGPLTGGSLFGGLSSVLPGLQPANDPFLAALTGANNNNNSQQHPQQNRLPFNFFGPHPNRGFAAVLNSTSPLTNLLTNQNLNPFLMPITNVGGGPLGQSLLGKPAATRNLFAPLMGLPQLQPHQQQLQHQQSGGNSPQTMQATHDWLPGIKVSESSSSSLPAMGQSMGGSPFSKDLQQQPQQQQPQQHQTEPIQQLQQQVETPKA